MFKKIILIIFLAINFAIFSTNKAFAEFVIFRDPDSKGGHNCHPVTLSENINARFDQEEDKPDECVFNVDVFPQGEWEKAGGPFDSPPYQWGTVYTPQKGENMYLLCEKPVYEIDLSSLPSYVKLEKEEGIIPNMAYLPTEGKKYSFSYTNEAKLPFSFNLKVSFTTPCKMYQFYGANNYLAMNPVYSSGKTEHKSSCSDFNPIEINPRKVYYSLPITITKSCTPPTPTLTPSATPIPTATLTLIPSATPLPTATLTPVPSSTPRPTATLTPRPTSTPLPTPTPEPPVSCSCWLLNAEGSPDLARVTRGQTLNFVAEAYVNTPDTAKVKNMVFILTHQDSSQEIDNSGEITASFNRQEVINGQNVDVYRSTYSYTVSSSDPEGLYLLHLGINCAWKEGNLLNSNVKILGTSTEKSGFSFRALLQRLFGFITGSTPTPTPTIPFEAPFPTTIRPTGRSLQLGTFGPVPTLPPSACIDLYFQVIEKGKYIDE